MNWEKSPKEGSRKKERERKILVYFACTLSEGTSSGERIRYLHQTDAWCCVTTSLNHHSRHPASMRFECVCVCVCVWVCVCVCVCTFSPSLIHFNLCRWQWDVRLDVDAYLMSQMLPLLMRSPLCVICRLSPEIFLKRPVVEGNRWRLDSILKRKAVS